MPVEIRELVIRAVVITVSDACSRGERKDASGELLLELLSEIGAEIVTAMILSDDADPLADALRDFAARSDVNLIVTTGGTGLAPRDNTPEATLAVIEREAPGIAEAMRLGTLKQTRLAMLSRGVCGTLSGTLIVNLPGSPKAVRESFAVIAPVLKHAIALLAGKPGGDLH
jgi:molybdenum cofactor synthesis domain-containing protein